jgi:hypothetical protein
MRWAVHVARMGDERKRCTSYWWESTKERDHWDDRGVDGRIRSEWLLWRLAGGSVSCGFVLLRIRIDGGLLRKTVMNLCILALRSKCEWVQNEKSTATFARSGQVFISRICSDQNPWRTYHLVHFILKENSCGWYILTKSYRETNHIKKWYNTDE